MAGMNIEEATLFKFINVPFKQGKFSVAKILRKIYTLYKLELKFLFLFYLEFRNFYTP